MENDKQKTLHEKYVVNVKERFVILSIHDIYTIMHLKPMIQCLCVKRDGEKKLQYFYQ